MDADGDTPVVVRDPGNRGWQYTSIRYTSY